MYVLIVCIHTLARRWSTSCLAVQTVALLSKSNVFCKVSRKETREWGERERKRERERKKERESIEIVREREKECKLQ